MAERNVQIIPGDSPDPDDDVERGIKAAWALGGMAMSAGVLTYALKGTGFVFLPTDAGPLDYARAFAFLIACTNILCWIWFPLEDLRVLRTWIRVRKTAFAAHTSEFLLMMSAAILLIFLIISSTINSFFFCVIGTAIYAINLLGFAMIRRQVARAIAEARENYRNEASSEKRKLLLDGLDVIQMHWSVSPTDGWLKNRQQIRHASLTIAFLVAAFLAYQANVRASASIGAWAYMLGAFTIIAAEVSIAAWRISRDRLLHGIFEELRFVSYRLAEQSSTEAV